MQVRSQLSAFLFLAACSSGDSYETVQVAAGTASPIDTCVVDRQCELTGTIIGQRRSGDASWATLMQRKACIALLLPPDIYARWEAAEGRRARVRGMALTRGQSAEGVTLVEYRGRWLSPMTCGVNDTILYVDELTVLR